jgi:hypothetical protein
MYNISSNSRNFDTHRCFPLASSAKFFCIASGRLKSSKYQIEYRYSCLWAGARKVGLAGLGRMFTVDRLSRRLLYQGVCVVPAVCRVAGTDGAGQNPSTKIQQHTPPTPGGDRRQAFTSFNFIGLRAFRSRRRAARFSVLERNPETPAPRKSLRIRINVPARWAVGHRELSGAKPCFPGGMRGYNAAFCRATNHMGKPVGHDCPCRRRQRRRTWACKFQRASPATSRYWICKGASRSAQATTRWARSCAGLQRRLLATFW